MVASVNYILHTDSKHRRKKVTLYKLDYGYTRPPTKLILGTFDS